jgi:Mg2+ and Co2+ transporter CorA
MANIRHPLFLTGILALLLHLAALALRTSRNNSVADILTIAGAGLMVVCWVWSIFAVANTGTLQGSQKKFWLIAVIAIPFVGGMLYQIMHSKRNTIVD